jgi:hypothetical protein
VELVAQAIPVLGTAQEHRTIALLAGATRTASGFGLQPPRVRQRIEEAIREARAALGDDRFAAVQAEGTLIGVDEAVTITRSALQRIDER